MHSKIYPQGPFTPHPDNVDTSCRDKEGWMGVMERIRMRRSPGLTILIRYPLPLIFCHHHLSLLSSSSSNIIRRTLVPIFCLYLSGKKGGGERVQLFLHYLVLGWNGVYLFCIVYLSPITYVSIVVNVSGGTITYAKAMPVDNNKPAKKEVVPPTTPPPKICIKIFPSYRGGRKGGVTTTAPYPLGRRVP